MPTVINNPSGSEGSGSNFLVATVLIIVILVGFVLFFMYGLPAIQGPQNQNPNDAKNDTNINVTVPEEIIPGNQNPPPAN